MIRRSFCWVWDEYRRLALQAKAKADGRAGNIRFSELVQRWRELELSGLNPGGASAYEDSLKPIETFFVERKEDPPIHNIKPADIKEFLAWRRTALRVGDAKEPRRLQRAGRPEAAQPAYGREGSARPASADQLKSTYCV